MSGAEGQGPEISILSTTLGDPTRMRAPYTAPIGDKPVRIYHGNFIVVGTMADAEQRPMTVSMAVGIDYCPCPANCDAPGRAFELSPTPEHARMLAAQLIEAAEQVEAAAADRARSVIDKARGR